MDTKIQKIIGSGIIVGLCVAGFLGYSISNSNKDTAPVDTGTNSGQPTGTPTDIPARTLPDAALPKPTPTSPAPTANNNPVVNTPVADVKTSKYKDGTYVAIGSYQSPAGLEQVRISLSIKNDVILNTSATNIAKSRTSIRYEAEFIAGYKTLVIGKKLDSVRLNRVSGSSLTPNGFNDAVAKIKAQALS
jgi:uncharacterized protein with FMN-binding domain